MYCENKIKKSQEIALDAYLAGTDYLKKTFLILHRFLFFLYESLEN